MLCLSWSLLHQLASEGTHPIRVRFYPLPAFLSLLLFPFLLGLGQTGAEILKFKVLPQLRLPKFLVQLGAVIYILDDRSRTTMTRPMDDHPHTGVPSMWI